MTRVRQTGLANRRIDFSAKHATVEAYITLRDQQTNGQDCIGLLGSANSKGDGPWTGKDDRKKVVFSKDRRRSDARRTGNDQSKPRKQWKTVNRGSQRSGAVERSNSEALAKALGAVDALQEQIKELKEGNNSADRNEKTVEEMVRPDVESRTEFSINYGRNAPKLKWLGITFAVIMASLWFTNSMAHFIVGRCWVELKPLELWMHEVISWWTGQSPFDHQAFWCPVVVPVFNVFHQFLVFALSFWILWFTGEVWAFINGRYVHNYTLLYFYDLETREKVCRSDAMSLGKSEHSKMLGAMIKYERKDVWGRFLSFYPQWLLEFVGLWEEDVLGVSIELYSQLTNPRLTAVNAESMKHVRDSLIYAARSVHSVNIDRFETFNPDRNRRKVFQHTVVLAYAYWRETYESVLGVDFPVPQLV
jgi:hypothetical protein